MKIEMFHLMPYRELPEDFREKYHSVWVDVPADLMDPPGGPASCAPPGPRRQTHPGGLRRWVGSPPDMRREARRRLLAFVRTAWTLH